jgi:hypothetical protein
MARKVKIQNIAIPLLISYVAGAIASQLIYFLANAFGEKFWVIKPNLANMVRLVSGDILNLSLLIALLAFVVSNVSLFLGRSRVYVLVLGYSLFLAQTYAPFAQTNNWNTCIWLEFVQLGLSAPIFYAIYKYIPKQNKI